MAAQVGGPHVLIFGGIFRFLGRKVVKHTIGNAVAHFLKNKGLKVEELRGRMACVVSLGVVQAFVAEGCLQKIHLRRGEVLVHGSQFGIAQLFHGGGKRPERVAFLRFRELPELIQAFHKVSIGFERGKQLACIERAGGGQNIQRIAGGFFESFVSSGNFGGSTEPLIGNRVAFNLIESNGRTCSQLYLVLSENTGFFRNTA